jgi:hypothetical protein
LRLNLHELVDLLCEASPGERAKALAQVRRRQRLYLQLQEYLDEKDGRLGPESVPLAQPIPESSAPAVLEGDEVQVALRDMHGLGATLSLRLQIETEIIPHWNSPSTNANSA